jgi:UPF0716 family protein affecting phage T7 exclusion
MWQSLARGYKFALAVLAVELLLSFGLVSDSLGIFVILAMTLVAIAWLPAAMMIYRDVQAGDSSAITGYAIAAICGLLGILSLYTIVKWTALSMVVK